MTSADQTGRLGFSKFAGLGDLQVGYALQDWIEVQLSLMAAAFASDETTGGLLSPMLGAALSVPLESIRPYLELDLGPGWTGRLLRPIFRASVGLEVRLTHALGLGPLVGYAQVFQSNEPGASTDARFIWFGLRLCVRPDTGDRDLPKRAQKRVNIVRRYVEVRSEPEPKEARPRAPGSELEWLIDQAVPAQRVELLAPVLFKFDSDELESVGVAMLHEVARELARRPDIKLVEVQGYADSRGSVAYNTQLSERRAERVIAWLVEHGVVRERLRAAARGSSELVERGTSEGEHEQNRRVVFRVVEAGAQ